MDYKTNHYKKNIFKTNYFYDKYFSRQISSQGPPDRPYGTLTNLTLTKGQAPGPSLLFIIGYEKLLFV